VSIRLVGIDVDGTLVGQSGIVDERIWRAAAKLVESGVRLTLCSGRPAYGVAREYAQRLDAAGWHVFQNGASVVNLHDGRSRSTPLPAGSIAELIAHSRAARQILELYGDTGYVVERDTPWSRQHAALLGLPFLARPFESLQQPVVRAQWLVSPAEVRAFVARATAEMEVAASTSPLMPDTTFVGITRRGVSKGAALQTIAAELGIALQDVMYVGDAPNDLSALNLVGHPVAMGNADDTVKHAARRVVGDVEDAGLGEALEWALERGA
jgi:Cof subfamily protein (haloacid dehalogenase superfamily)